MTNFRYIEFVQKVENASKNLKLFEAPKSTVFVSENREGYFCRKLYFQKLEFCPFLALFFNIQPPPKFDLSPKKCYNICTLKGQERQNFIIVCILTTNILRGRLPMGKQLKR